MYLFRVGWWVGNILFLQHIRQVGIEKKKRHVLAPQDHEKMASNGSEHEGIDVTPKQADKTIHSARRTLQIASAYVSTSVTFTYHQNMVCYPEVWKMLTV